MIILRILLLPVSMLYAMVIFVRNRLYDCGMFGSSRGALPTVVIGNLTAGGTGKTPHAEYLIQWLKQEFSVALLSRGYRRKSQGFILADPNSTVTQIGDEPFQIHQKFPEIAVAVCESRIAGLDELKSLTKTELVILDDAFQHRQLRGDVNILLCDYSRPWWRDWMLPSGGLRDNRLEKRRADVIIITKCPETLSDAEKNNFLLYIQPTEHQHVFFTSITYSEPIRLSGPSILAEQIRSVVGFAGLANPSSFKEHLKKQYSLKKFKEYPDHHFFSGEDISKLWEECGNFAAPDFGLITTEKDAVRLSRMKEINNVPVFYIPIKVSFLGEEEKFRKVVLEKIKSATTRSVFHN